MTAPDDKRKPWMKFYPADWQADEGLRQCSLSARGLWIEMIAVMHKAAVYGHLLIAGIKPTEQMIAMHVGSDVKAVKAGLAELETWRVLSRTSDGIIFSRRMVKDAEKAATDATNGGRGGNPKLSKGVNPPDNPDPNPTVKAQPNPSDNEGDKAQRLEARSQKESKQAAREPEPAIQPPPQPRRGDPPDAWLPLAEKRETDSRTGETKAVVGGYYLNEAADQVCEAARINDANWRGDWRPMKAWLAEGIDLHGQILPAIRRVAERPRYQPPASLAYFDRAVREQGQAA